MRHPIVRGHHEVRRYHLTTVHGVEKAPRLHDEGPTTKRRRTKKEEALATQAKIEGVRARQRRNNNTVSTKPKPNSSGLFDVRDSKARLDPWWRCDWPGCSFSLEQDEPNKNYRRKQHLKQVHGLKQVPDLRTLGGLASLPVRQTAADSVFDKRWQLTHANFLKKIWKTAHRIECEPCSYRVWNSPTGLPKTRAVHRCEERCRWQSVRWQRASRPPLPNVSRSGKSAESAHLKRWGAGAPCGKSGRPRRLRLERRRRASGAECLD